MWPDRVSNPGPLTYESGALPTALRGPVSRTIVHSYNGSSILSFDAILRHLCGHIRMIGG